MEWCGDMIPLRTWFGLLTWVSASILAFNCSSISGNFGYWASFCSASSSFSCIAAIFSSCSLISWFYRLKLKNKNINCEQSKKRWRQWFLFFRGKRYSLKLKFNEKWNFSLNYNGWIKEARIEKYQQPQRLNIKKLLLKNSNQFQIFLEHYRFSSDDINYLPWAALLCVATLVLISH